MIKLSVMEYCEDCPEFEAHVEKREYMEDDAFSQFCFVKSNTVVTCAHRDRCELVKTYLRNKLKEKEKKDHVKPSGSDTAEN